MDSNTYPKNRRKNNQDRRQSHRFRMENSLLERRKSDFDRRVVLQQQMKDTDDPMVIYEYLYWKGIQN